MTWHVRATTLCATVLFFGLTVLALHQADAKRNIGQNDYMYLPNKTILKHFTVGMNPIIADLLWLECIQYTGRAFRSTHDYTWIENMVRTASALDPHFVELYRYGGMFLASLKGDGEAAITLLESGIIANPASWELPYEVAMVYLLNRSEEPNSKCNAKNYVAISVATGQAPGFVNELYEGLKDQCETQSRNPCEDLQFEAETYQRLFNTGEEVMQDVAREKMEMLQLKKICCDLMALLEKYKQQTGSAPTGLDNLLAAGILAELPPDPKGGSFFLDKDGIVKNTTVIEEQIAKFKPRIQDGIKKYYKKTGHYPKTLSAMLENHTLSFLPPYPYASKTWDYDPATGALR